MTDQARVAELMSRLSANGDLAAAGYSMFMTPAGALVIQKERIFQGLWSEAGDALKWTPAAGGGRPVLVTTLEDAVALTLAMLPLR